LLRSALRNWTPLRAMWLSQLVSRRWPRTRIADMHRTCSLAVAVASLVLVGCTPSEPGFPQTRSTSVSPSVAASTDANLTCIGPAITVKRSGAPTSVIVAARLRDPAAALAGEPGEAVWDEPVTSALIFDSDTSWLTRDPVRQLLADSAQTSKSIGLSDVDAYLRSVTNNVDTVVGYAAEDVQTSTVQIVCTNGLTAHGVLTNWVLVEIGVVVCGNSTIVPPEESTAMEAKARFCNTGAIG